jgi:hypothetical protein
MGHIQFGLFCVQYLMPLAFTDPFGYACATTVRLYTEIMAIGACIFLLALPIGFSSPRFSLTDHRVLSIPPEKYRRIFNRRVITVMLLSTLGLLVGFALMGFVPIFAANPLDAKYFHGAYHPGYMRAAVIYRPSYLAFLAYLPLAFVVAATQRKVRHYLLIVIGVAVFAGCLNRGPLGMALVAGAGILVAAKRGRIIFATYLLLTVIFIVVGTLGNYLLDVYFALKIAQPEGKAGISELVSQGAPDVSEGIRFFDNFVQHKEFTYGAQFVAAFIPAQTWTMEWIPLARYNPGLWAQGVLLGTQDQKYVRNVGGAGIRLATPICGYATFGWLGVLLVSAAFGYLTGYLVRFARNYAGRGAIEQSAVVIAMYITLGIMLFDPAALALQWCVSALMLAWLIYPIRIRFAGVERRSGVLTPAFP